MNNINNMQVLDNKGLILIEGPDSTKFLQGLITNDINKAEHGLIYTLMLNSQSKYLFEFFIIKIASGYLIELPDEDLNNFINKLKIYKLRSQIYIQDVSDKYRIIFSDDPIQNSLISVPDPRFNKLGFKTIIEKDNINLEPHNISDLYNIRKYEFALPDRVDFIIEKSFPLEYGLEELNAISFEKGCYIGQELISRTKYRGEVRKKIYKLSFLKDSSIVTKNTEVMIDDKIVGIICSSWENYAIALLREEGIRNFFGDSQPVIVTVNGIEAQVSLPEWRKPAS